MVHVYPLGAVKAETEKDVLKQFGLDIIGSLRLIKLFSREIIP